MSPKWLFEQWVAERIGQQPELLGALEVPVLFVVPGEQGGSWLVDPGRRAVISGRSSGEATLTVSATDLMRIARGELNPRKAWETGRLALAGRCEPALLPALLRLLQARRSEPAPGDTVVTMRERPDLIPVADAITGGGWPEFMLHNTVARRYWKDLAATFPEFQFALLDARREDVVGVGNSVPLVWRRDVDGWPDDGWNWAVKKAFEDREAGRAPCAQCGLSITIAPAHRGKGFGKQMVQAMRAIARSHGFSEVILPVRPSRKSQYPLAPMEQYIHWKGRDGRPFDPWIRAHAEAGGRIIRACPRSALIAGTVRDWEEWTKMSFPASGVFTVPGALVPVEIDVESDRGQYTEPNVWICHNLD